jgi:hypothetical protein
MITILIITSSSSPLCYEELKVFFMSENRNATGQSPNKIGSLQHNGGGILLAFSTMEGRSGRYLHLKLASS